MKKFSTPDTNFDQLNALLVNSQDAKENNSRYLVLRKLISGAQLLKNSLGDTVKKTDKISLTDQIDGILPPTNGGVATGRYTPALTLIANLSGAGVDDLYFSTTGGLVNVFGRFQVTPTAVGINTELGFKLPIISYFQFDYQCAGSAYSPTVNQGAAIIADVVNNRAILKFLSVSNTTFDLFFNFGYIIIEQ